MNKKKTTGFPGRVSRSTFSSLFLYCAVLILLAGCAHTPDALPEPDGARRVYEADEKTVRKAVARVLSDRGFGRIQPQGDPGRLKTDFVPQGDWRTRLEGEIQQISRRETEVFLQLITEKRSSGGWERRNLAGRDQYDTLFSEIEMQIYREWANPE